MAELESAGRRHTHPAIFSHGSSTYLTTKEGTRITFRAENDISSGAESFRELQQQLRRRVSRIENEEIEDKEIAIEERDIDEIIAELPVWYKQITLRSILVATFLGVAFIFIALKLNLTTGVIPSLNISAGLLGFFSVSVLKRILDPFKLGGGPFTPQENTVIQTAVVACYGLVYSGGYGTYLLGMDLQSCTNLGDSPGNGPCSIDNPMQVQQPDISKTIPYLLCISCVGIFFLVPLRNLFILKLELPFPSGTATGLMINSFFTKEGSDIAGKQVACLFKWFTVSFIWSFWKWFFTAEGDCGTVQGGFDVFPTFSIQALQWTWNFNFQINYIGVGMICPWIVDYSTLVGAVLSWGIMWPLISQQEGNWYPAGLSRSDFRGLYAYKVFISLGLFLGDGGYVLVKLIILGIMDFRARRKINKFVMERTESGRPAGLPSPTVKSDDDDRSLAVGESMDTTETPHERKLRRKVFQKDAIPWYIGIGGYIVLLVVCAIAIPNIYPYTKWYYVLVSGVLAPLLAFINAYGAGLTDWNVASVYGKVCILIFSAWAGEQGGVIAGLGVCGLVMAAAASASDLQQDFKTGYITKASPRAMFVSQIFGALLGAVLVPLCFLLFWNAFPIGDPSTLYSAPMATIYRGMAVLAVSGLDALPDHCVQLAVGFFGVAIFFNLLRDFLPKKAKAHLWVPLPMAMGIVFFIGAWLAIDMTIGGLIVLIWSWMDQKNGTDGCSMFSAVVASGLIAGDGIWSIPSAILAIAGVKPPICMGWSKGT